MRPFRAQAEQHVFVVKLLPRVVQGIFEYGGVKHELVPAPTGASSEGCERLMKLVLKQNEPCGAEQVRCSSWGHAGMQPEQIAAPAVS